jgi:hypothetical protein
LRLRRMARGRARGSPPQEGERPGKEEYTVTPNRKPYRKLWNGRRRGRLWLRPPCARSFCEWYRQ